MIRIILNLKNPDSSFVLAGRAGQYLVDNPEKNDALLEYGGIKMFYAKRNKKSISVWEQ